VEQMQYIIKLFALHIGQNANQRLNASL